MYARSCTSGPYHHHWPCPWEEVGKGVRRGWEEAGRGLGGGWEEAGRELGGAKIAKMSRRDRSTARDLLQNRWTKWQT